MVADRLFAVAAGRSIRYAFPRAMSLIAVIVLVYLVQSRLVASSKNGDEFWLAFLGGGLPAMAVLWYEAEWKPRRSRRRTAGVLLEEVHRNHRYLQAIAYDFARNRDERFGLSSLEGWDLRRSSFEALKGHVVELYTPPPFEIFGLYDIYSDLEQQLIELRQARQVVVGRQALGFEASTEGRVFDLLSTKLYNTLLDATKRSEKTVITLHWTAQPPTPLRDYFRAHPYEDSLGGWSVPFWDWKVELHNWRQIGAWPLSINRLRRYILRRSFARLPATVQETSAIYDYGYRSEPRAYHDSGCPVHHLYSTCAVGAIVPHEKQCEGTGGLRLCGLCAEQQSRDQLAREAADLRRRRREGRAEQT